MSLIQHIQELQSAFGAAVAHLGSSTHEDKQSVSPDMLATLRAKATAFLIATQPSTQQEGAFANASVEPPKTASPSSSRIETLP
jgi:hypothetical protein